MLAVFTLLVIALGLTGSPKIKAAPADNRNGKSAWG